MKIQLYASMGRISELNELEGKEIVHCADIL